MMFAVCYIIFNIIKESCSKVSSEVAASVAGSCMVMSFISGSGQQWAAVGRWNHTWSTLLKLQLTVRAARLCDSQSCTDCMLDWAAHPFSWAQLLLGDAMILKYIKHLRMKIFGRLDFTLVSWCINAVGYSL